MPFFHVGHRDQQRMRRFMSLSDAGLAAPVTGLWSPLSLTVPPTVLLDHLSTMTNSGGTVSAWSDRSGGGNNVTNTGTAQPFYNAADINGYSAARADGGVTGSSGGQWLQNGSANSLYNNASQGWLFGVYKLDGTSSTQARAVVVATTNSAAAARLEIASDSSAGAGKPNLRVRRLDADSVATIVGPSALNDGNYHMVMGWMNWGTREGRLYVDGNTPTTNTTLTAAAGNTSATNSSILAVVGSASNVSVLNGRQAVGIFGSTLPSDAEVDKLFGYYAHQLGLTGNLPSGHPYKTTPP